MSVTLNVPQPIATCLQQNDADRRRAERLIVAAFDDSGDAEQPLTFEEKLNRLAILVPRDVPVLSDYAVSRESMYNEHERHM